MSKRLSLEEKEKLLLKAAMIEVERRGGITSNGDYVDVAVLREVLLDQINLLEEHMAAAFAADVELPDELKRAVADDLDRTLREVRAQIIADLAPRQ